jgi:hypothetical protein
MYPNLTEEEYCEMRRRVREYEDDLMGGMG